MHDVQIRHGIFFPVEVTISLVDKVITIDLQRH
jgi:hypothetical protein